MTRARLASQGPEVKQMGPRIAARVTMCIALVANSAGVLADDSTGPPPIELDPLVREALANHPAAAAAKHVHAALEEVPSQVGTLPDPVFTTSVQNVRIDDLSLDGHPMTGVVFGLSQGLPFPGKRARRREAAERMADVAAQQLLAVESALELRVRERYWALHLADRTEALLRESERALDLLTDVIHVRYSVGQGAQQDVLQVQVAHSRLRAHLQQLGQVSISARRALNTAVGRPASAKLASTQAPPTVGPLLDRVDLARMAGSQNPELRVATTAVEAASAAVRAASRDRLPDFAIGLGYRARAAAPGDMSNGADMVSVTIGMTLPIWAGDKQHARTRQTRQDLLARGEYAASLVLDIQDAVARTADEIERLTAQIELYRKELVPESDQAVAASIADYQVGRVGFVSVLQNWRTQLEVKVEYEQLLADRAGRVARLRALCGGPVERNVR